MEISLTSYRVFYEVASESNISRAARKLSISQPAISKSLSKLEAGLGTKLLKRSSRGVALTPEGEVLYARLKDAFGYIEKGEREIRQMRDFNIGQLKMGASTTLSKYILMPYLKDYFRDYPYTKVTIENNPSAPTIERVEKGALDLGIVVVNHPRKGMEFKKVMDVEDIFVCTPDYLKNLKTVYGEDVDLLEEANFLMLFKDNDTRKHVDEYFKGIGREPMKIMEVTTMDLLIDFAKVGMGIANVEKEFVLQELHDGTLVRIPLKEPIPKRQCGFIYAANNQNEALKSFLESTK